MRVHFLWCYEFVVNFPLTAFKKSTDFVIQGTAMKQPNSRAIIKLYCKKYIHKNTIFR